jgi:hypothetical protein
LKWLGDCSYNKASHSIRLIYKFNPESAPESTLKLKIEINTREHQSMFKLKNYRFDIDSENVIAEFQNKKLPKLLR